MEIQNFVSWLALSGNRLSPTFFTELNIQAWIDSNLGMSGDWASIFSHMLWYTWKDRNELVFEGKDVDFGRRKTLLKRDEFSLIV